MNDSMLFLAFATIFGAAMLTVGWALRRELEAREVRQALRKYAAELDETDAAGA